MDTTSSYNSSVLPKIFTIKSILKVHQGMSSNKILKLFGEPKSFSSSICGGANSRAWNCSTWEYGNPPYENARFTFSGEHGSYKQRLNKHITKRRSQYFTLRRVKYCSPKTLCDTGIFKLLKQI